MPYPWSAGNVLTATDLNSSIAAKTDTAMTQNAQTGTTYSFALADASKLLTTSNASPVSVTVTKQATVTWVTGTQLRVMNLGAGVTTLVADTGVTINNNKALAQYQGGTLIRTASDVWLFVPTTSGGPIAQVVRATDTTDRSTTSTSPVDVTGMAVTITPKSATSNIMIILVASLSNASSSSGSNHYAEIRITDASNVGISGAQAVGEGLSSYSGSGTMTNFYPVVMIAWASPGSTAAVTYKARFSTGSAATTTTFRNATTTGQMFAIEVSA